ncbi:hypothetical protein Tco_0451659 [Tanacetum coccineum]
MRTRSQARKRRQQQVRQTSVESPNLEKPNNSQETFNPPIVTMADNRTMAQLLEAPTEGYEDAIVVPEITANNFEIKHGLLNLVPKQAVLDMIKKTHMLTSDTSTRSLPTMKFPTPEYVEQVHVLKSRSKAIVSKVSTSSSTPAVSSDVAELKDMVRALILDKKNLTPAPAPVKAVEQSCVTCGGGHSYQDCPATDGNIYRDNIQEYVSQAAAVNYSQGTANYRPQVVANQIRPPGSGSLLRNTIANSKGDVKAITTRSGVSYNEPELERSSFPTILWSLINVADPRVPLILGRPFLRTARALIDVHVDVIDIACEEYVQEVLEISESGNPTSTSDLMIDSPSFTPFGGSDFLMEEIDAFLEHDNSIPPGVDGIYDSEGDTVYLEELLSVIDSDPNLPSSPVCEINVPNKIKSSCEDPPDQELKDLPSHLEYAFLEGDDKYLINAKNLKDEDKTALIKISGYFQIPIELHYYQEKTTFTCSNGTFAYRRILLGYAMQPGTFQRRMVAIFHIMN